MASRWIILYSLVWLSYHASIAQTADTTSLFSIGLRAHRSFIIQHSGKLSDAVTASNPWIVETDFNWHLRNPNTVEYCNCYPRAGLSLHYTNFDMPEILGSALSVYAFIEPYILAQKRLNYSIRFGLGPSFLTTLYDEESNPDNLYFSAPVSFLVLLNFNVNYRLTTRLNLHATASYNHISNGGYSEPNLGMNFPSLSIGADYSFSDISFQPPATAAYDPARAGVQKKNRVSMVTGLSAKPTTSGLTEKRYPVYVVGVNYSRTVARIVALNAGAEWVSDRSLYHSLRERNITDQDGGYSGHNRLGMLVGVDWLFGRFVFYQHLGVYVYSPVKAESKIYQRYGLSLYLSKNLFAGINIKAHGQDADFMDVRVGYAVGQW